MTVSVTSAPQVSYIYSAPGDFAFNYRILGESDVKLYVVDGQGVRTGLVYTQDYTVTLTNGGDGGCVCHVTSTTFGTLQILRKMSFAQTTDWTNAGPFNGELLEDDLDKIVMLLQDLNLMVNGEFTVASWRGVWTAQTPLSIGDLITDPTTKNIYVAIDDFVSSDSFGADLKNSKLQLVFDVEYLETLKTQASGSATEAVNAKNITIASEAIVAGKTEICIESADSAMVKAGEASSSASDAATDAVAAHGYMDTAKAISLLGDRVTGLATGTIVATAGQTNFTVSAFAENEILVFLNGMLLEKGSDYNATTPYPSTEVVLTSGAVAGDVLIAFVFNTAAHSIASHADTIATGAQLDELVQDETHTELHCHKEFKWDAAHDWAMRINHLGTDRIEISSNYALRIRKDLRVLLRTHLIGAYNQTTDPHDAGQVWNNGGVLTFSAG